MHGAGVAHDSRCGGTSMAPQRKLPLAAGVVFALGLLQGLVSAPAATASAPPIAVEPPSQ